MVSGSGAGLGVSSVTPLLWLTFDLTPSFALECCLCVSSPFDSPSTLSFECSAFVDPLVLLGTLLWLLCFCLSTGWNFSLPDDFLSAFIWLESSNVFAFLDSEAVSAAVTLQLLTCSPEFLLSLFNSPLTLCCAVSPTLGFGLALKGSSFFTAVVDTFVSKLQAEEDFWFNSELLASLSTSFAAFPVLTLLLPKYCRRLW